MNEPLQSQTLAKFQNEVQDTSKSNAIIFESELQDNFNDKIVLPDSLNTTCSNCKKDFLTSSLEANLFDKLCGKCNQGQKESMREGK